MKKVISIALALLMVAVMLPVMAMAEGANVAKIGNKEYASLKDAVNAVTDATETVIELLTNCEGAGIVINEGRNITIDFCGFTYTVSGDPLAGSSGTQNQCFQLLKNSTITLKNGKIVANNSGILRMIQNYSDLTLDNMTLDATVGTNSLRDNTSLICNDCGHTTIKDTTIVTKTDAGIAIDVEYWASRYPQGGSVSIGGASDINGKVRYIVDDPADEDAINRANNGNLRLSIDSGRVGGIVNHNGGVSANIEISGGTFNTDVTPYVGQYILAVTDGSTYYVGGVAYDAVRNATGGTFTVKNAERGTIFNVKPGVTIVNNSGVTITVNDKEVPTGDTYTVPGAPIIIYTPTEDTSKADNQKNPSTGANDFVGVAAAMAVVSLLGAAAVIRKK